MWSESDSDTFIEYGRYFVPAREAQLETIAALIPPADAPFTVWELGCGAGLLAEAILTRHPNATVVGWDGSERMRDEAQQRLARFGARFRTAHFDLAAQEWRQAETTVRAIVSSLVIHHLDDEGKATLYRDLYPLLEPRGALVIADLIQPASAEGVAAAAQAWDDAVRERALMLDGNSAAYDAFVAQHWNLYRYPDPMDIPSRLADHLQWLAAAGFHNPDVYWLQAGHAIYGAGR